jgi:hypothetical protein
MERRANGESGAASRAAALGFVALGFVLAFAVGSGGDARGDAHPRLPGPSPRGRAEGYDARAENARCEACHEDVAAEWRGSLHQRAWTDPVFTSAYVLEPIAFCRGCHAPEADARSSPPEGARAVGVGCVTCHVEDGEIIGARGRAPSGEVHGVRADPRLATTAACASCHEFDFPRRQGALMQGTVTEHRQSRHADSSCQTCHMKASRGPSGKPRRDHRFAAHDDPALLRSAVEARAAGRSERTITVSLRAGRVGHAFPTGDMFRRLEVRASAVDMEGKPSFAAPPVVLERVFRADVGGNGADRVEVRDDRVAASGEERDVVLTFPESIDGRTVRWEVAYQRMGHAMAASFGVDQASDEVVVARGTLDGKTTPGKTP